MGFIEHFHFKEPFWLQGLLLCPLVWLYFKGSASVGLGRLKQFADEALLPYLLSSQATKKKKYVRLASTLALALFFLALAAPRWNYEEVKVYRPGSSMIVLLDLSNSMNAKDVKPSRLERAKQEITDILKAQGDFKLGVVAFAAIPHIVTPLTDDFSAVEHFLDALKTDLIQHQGSNITEALLVAKRQLDADNAAEKAILLLTDGDFEEETLTQSVHQILGEEVKLHVLGFGEAQGSLIPSARGLLKDEKGVPVKTKLHEDVLEELASAGRGIYKKAAYHTGDTDAVLASLNLSVDKNGETKSQRIWQEQFVIFLIPLMFLILYLRRSSLFVLALCALPYQSFAQEGLGGFFMNENQKGEAYFKQENFASAQENFTDNFNKGISAYKAGDYKKAAKLLGGDAYNQANALALGGDLQKAVETLEPFVEANPSHTRAAENLEFLKKMLEQQQKNDQKQNQENKDQQQDKDKNKQQEEQNKDQQQQQEQEKEESEDKKQKDDQKKEGEEQNQNSQQQPGKTPAQMEADRYANEWLERLEGQPKDLLKNQFLIEAHRANIKESKRKW